VSDILSPKHASRLAHFAASNVLIGFDFDGTLAPIAARPELARMRPRTRQLLREVARRYPCIVISGRRRADLRKRLESMPVWHLAGNHGSEPWGENPANIALVREWAQILERRLAGHAGVIVENKKYSLAVHYRGARAKHDVVLSIKRALRSLHGARVMGGSQAINILPRGAPDKGVALECARRLLACDSAVFVGDDDSDEAAFRALDRDRLLSIRVGEWAPSRASYRLRNQLAIDRLLEILVSLRPKRTRRPPRRRRTHTPS
jgi:trehalose 6-phosphate phosphatase